MIVQGGGIYVEGGDVTIQNTNIYENSAGNVRLHVERSQKLPVPLEDISLKFP